MGTKQTRGLPSRLETVRRRIERWRRARKARSRIPDSLWASAVEVARSYGVHRAAKALRLDYYALKKRVGQEATAAPGRHKGSDVAAFLELAAPGQTGFANALGVGGRCWGEDAGPLEGLRPPIWRR